MQRTRRRMILWRCALIAVVALAGWAAFLSPFLKVQRVTVSGGRHTTAQQVARAAGLDSADNLLLVSTASVAAEAARLPWVKTVDVERKLPGTVKVIVTERKPVMVLSAEGRQWLVDSEGRVLDSNTKDRRLPVIAGSPVGDVEPGTTLRGQEVAGALAVFGSLPPSLKQRLDAIVAPTAERLTLALRDGTQVRYGAAQELSSKNEVLQVLLRRLGKQGSAVAYIDVRVPTNPAVAGPAPADVPAPVIPTPAVTPRPSPSAP